MKQTFPLNRTLEIFNKIAKIPRCSGNEQQISEWLVKWANDHKLSVKQDQVGNVVIDVPATEGFETAPKFVLQGHMDMVGQKTSESTHDFSKDPILTVIEDGWMKSTTGTTLGADNGIAVAMALAIAESEDLAHAGFEILITVDEETGLVGAANLSNDFVTAKNLINIDSEDEGEITIGCAGSQTIEISKQYTFQKASGDILVKVSFRDGKGGHSGVQIQDKIANTNELLARLLTSLTDKFETELHEITGGSVRNGIPTKSSAQFLVKKSELFDLENQVKVLSANLLGEYTDVEPNLKFEIEHVNADGGMEAISTVDSIYCIGLLMSIPHGVFAMSNDIKDAVESSINFAVISLNAGGLSITTMHRSSIASKMKWIENKLVALARISGAEINIGVSSAPWQPNAKSNLLTILKDSYTRLYGNEPKVTATHGGLECGIIGDKYPGMEMVSIGPTIKGAHTPEEKLEVSTVEKVGVWILDVISEG